jgi:glycosyltransferase involved in cell wall biosynthesis
MELSVIIPTHNPHPGRLQRTLAGLRAQTLPTSRWETLVIDNASTSSIDPHALTAPAPDNIRVVREPQLGLTHARKRGFGEARGQFAVLVDDDNILAADYLATVLELFAQYPKIGALGGRSLPEFESVPPAWSHEFHPLLALRDLGREPLVSRGLRPDGSTRDEYPAFAPIGAGMALRRAAWEMWIAARTTLAGPSDRRGGDLTSGGDNDIVLCALRAGWEVGYFPELALTHLIPVRRLEADYLARLNHDIQKSWMQVLRLHEANPWEPLTRTGALVRKWKAWLKYRPWTSPAAQIRWRGACGHFDGRVGP